MTVWHPVTVYAFGKLTQYKELDQCYKMNVLHTLTIKRL